MPDADAFDPERWELPDDAAPLARRRRAMANGGRRPGKFLMGPIDWTWLCRAMHLPGKSLAVGLMLWREFGCMKDRTVHFCLARAAAEGIPTTTARRAIRELEGAGLVTIRRKPGRGLEVTILDAPPQKVGASSGPTESNNYHA
jgi:hypothetical protein